MSGHAKKEEIRGQVTMCLYMAGLRVLRDQRKRQVDSVTHSPHWMSPMSFNSKQNHLMLNCSRLAVSAFITVVIKYSRA